MDGITRIIKDWIPFKKKKRIGNLDEQYQQNYTKIRESYHDSLIKKETKYLFIIKS